LTPPAIRGDDRCLGRTKEDPVPATTARAGIAGAIRFEGHAIVSADGMMAAADGSMPPGLRNDADWRQFQAALDASCLVVLGRLGHRRHPNTGRRRLVFTASVEAPTGDPDDPLALLFNPATASLAEVLARLDIGAGTIAVTGGTRVFDYFLPLYDRFALVEANAFVLPGGRPCFTTGHPRTVLAAAGLHPLGPDVLDAEAAVTVTLWERD
jgi:dihydrofolate reductase